jgi:hypothetical protein
VKIQIVRDDKGKVVASAEITKGSEASVKPILEKGQTVDEVEAADQYLHDLPNFYKHHEALKN